MAEKIVIAELDIDIQALLKTTSDLKKEIDKLKNSQKELAASGEGASEAFIENEAVLKSLNSAYAQNIKAIQETNKATSNQVDQAELLNLALTQEATSISEAREQNKLLNKLRNETNVSTKEGQAQLTALNAKLDQNNEFIKENADAYLKQKINIGNYSESIKDAFQDINVFNGGLGGFVQRSQEAGGAGNLLKNSFSAIGTAIMGMVRASLAFIATPIGAIIAAIVVVATAMYSIFKQFQPIVDKVEQTFAGLSATLSVVKNTIISIVTGAKSLGSAFSSLSGDMNKAYDSAVALTKAQQDLDDAMEAIDLSSAKARAEINKLNIQAKDRTKTEAERLALLEKAESLEKKVFTDKKAIANEQLRIAKEQIRVNLNATAAEIKNLETNFVKTKEALEKKGTDVEKYTNAYIAAQKAIYEVDNESTNNLEKNINKQNKLIEDREAREEKARQKRNEAAAKEKERQDKERERQEKAIDDAITQQEEELRFLEEKTRFEQDEIKRAEQLAAKEVEILKEKLKNKRISQTEFDTENLAIQNNIVELQNQRNAKELEDAKILEEKKLELQKEVDAKKAEKAAIDLENKIAAAENEFLQMQADFDRAYQAEIAAAEKTGADVALINAKYAKYQKQIDQELLNSKLNSYKATFNQLGSLFGENTVLAKAAAIAEVGITTYQKAFESFSQAKVYFSNPLTVPLGVNAAIQGGLTIAQGAATAAKISGVKFEQGGIAAVGGQRHSQGGTKFYGEDGSMFEAEKGEGIGVLNRKAFSAFMDFNNSFNGGRSAQGFFQGGGIITQGVRPESMDLNMIVDSIAQLPPPVVAVEEIQTVGNRYVNVRENANF